MSVPLLLRATQERSAAVARQHAPAASLAELARSLAGLHASRHSGPYVAAHARLGEVAMAQHGTALRAGGLVHLRCMRGTLHALPVPDASVAHAATLPQRQAASAARLARRSLGGATQRRLALAIEELLEHRQQMTVAEMTQELGHSFATDVVIAVVRDLWENGVILAWDSAGNPHRRQRTFCLASTLKEWECPDVAAAMEALLRSYLRAYGPASFDDIAWWTGWGKQRTARTCERLEHELLPVRVDGLSAELVALAEDEEFLRCPPETQPGAQVLAYEDPAIKAYYETRRRYLTDRCADSLLFWHAGEALACIWIAGVVVATWRWDALSAAVCWEPSSRLSKTERHHAVEALRAVESYLQAQLSALGRREG